MAAQEETKSCPGIHRELEKVTAANLVFLPYFSEEWAFCFGDFICGIAQKDPNTCETYTLLQSRASVQDSHFSSSVSPSFPSQSESHASVYWAFHSQDSYI